MCKLVLDTTYGEDRMNSSIPKAQMCICTMPMYQYILASFEKAGISEYALVGNPEAFTDEHVFQSAEDAIRSLKTDNIFYVRSDLPFLTPESIQDVLENHKTADSKITALYDIDESGEEIFAGVVLIKKEELLKNQDMDEAVSIAQKEHAISKVYSQSDEETFAVLDRCDLALAESIMRSKINDRLMLSGVSMIDPTTVYIAPDVQIGKDTVIYPNVILESGTMIGDRVYVGSNTTIHNSIIGDDCHILSSVILDSTIKHQTRLGPFAYIRPNSNIGPHAKIGDFVEVKNSTIGEKTSVAHLTYIGDSDVGSHINFGCGCVTVNYDGKNKYRCTIEDNSFIGCNTNLVAPVTVGEGSYIAAGSTITDEVPKNALAIARARQVNKTGWTDKRK